MKKSTFLEVVEIGTGKVVHTVNITSRVYSAERIIAGMLRNLDQDAHFVREVTR